MQLSLVRTTLTERSTIGELYVEGQFETFTLEDRVRPDGVKVYGETAIPTGTYVVTLDFSNRFQRIMPHVLDVPGFEGIRIHSGNTDTDTLGCILVGDHQGPDFIGESRVAFTRLFAKLQAAVDAGDAITLTISE